MKPKLTLFALALLITVLAGNAYGEMSAEKYLEVYDKAVEYNLKDLTRHKVYLAGIGAGLEWANQIITIEKGKKIWCQPGNLAITVEQNISMLKQIIKKFPYLKAFPVGAVLAEAYRYTFPCEKP